MMCIWEVIHTLWNNYAEFYNAIAIHAKTLWPDTKIATEITFGGLIAL
jgi:hypothetical protein